jgi:centromeric protein E
MLQPSLSGNARISVVCTINPEVSAIVESTSTLQFAQRIKKVQVRRIYPGYKHMIIDCAVFFLQLNATKKEIVDTEALIERYRNEIEDLKRRLEDKEKDAPARSRRLSAREVSPIRSFFPHMSVVLMVG